MHSLYTGVLNYCYVTVALKLLRLIMCSPLVQVTGRIWYQKQVYSCHIRCVPVPCQKPVIQWMSFVDVSRICCSFTGTYMHQAVGLLLSIDKNTYMVKKKRYINVDNALVTIDHIRVCLSPEKSRQLCAPLLCYLPDRGDRLYPCTINVHQTTWSSLCWIN